MNQNSNQGHTMTTRNILLTAAAVLALTVPAMAEDMNDAAKEAAIKNATQEQTGFSQGIKAIKGWFGSDTPDQIEPATGTSSADAGDDIQVPPALGVDNIEPAAGADSDNLQAPPRYMGDQSSNNVNATPRATSFDGNQSVAAFNDQSQPSAADVAQIQPAAGESAPDAAKMDCAAILKAADEAKEGDVPDTALIEACENEKDVPVDASMPAATPTEPAQPGFEGTPQPLPSTQPAAGEPPIGGATMPGGKAEEQPSKAQ